MIRDSLEPGARNVYQIALAGYGLILQRRAAPDSGTASSAAIPGPSPETTTLKPSFPAGTRLRLTRRGNMITAEYSTDDGRTLQTASDSSPSTMSKPFLFDPPLPETLYAGLAISAHNVDETSEAKFSDPEIRQR